MPAQLQLLSPATTSALANGASAAPALARSADTSANRDSALERRGRLTARLAKLAAAGYLAPLARQVGSLGGCARPIRMTGHRTRLDAATGQILDHLDTRHLPAGELLVRCGNRRTTRCPACSNVYRYDTYQLIAAGLRGGKTVPTSVSTHPRVFATLTAPGFGPVHNQPGAAPCTCGTRHADTDPLLGTPLNPERYDYTGAVLWNAHAPALWARFTTYLRREIANAAGLTQRTLRHHATLSYAKVAEYQKRGQIHFHTVIRIDGPTGPTSTLNRPGFDGDIEDPEGCPSWLLPVSTPTNCASARRVWLSRPARTRSAGPGRSSASLTSWTCTPRPCAAGSSRPRPTPASCPAPPVPRPSG